MSDELSVPADVLREIKYVRNQVWDLFGQWHLFTELFATQEIVDSISWAFNRGAGGLIHQALRTEIAVGLWRVLDKAADRVKKAQRHNLTIDRAIGHVEALRPALAGGMRDELTAIRNACASLQRWRDKYHAHRDHAVAMGLEPITRIDRETLDSAFGALRRLMDRICSVLDGSTTPYEAAYEGAAAQLLALVLPKYRASRERLRMAEESL